MCSPNKILLLLQLQLQLDYQSVTGGIPGNTLETSRKHRGGTHELMKVPTIGVGVGIPPTFEVG